jgi:hypothetical protein
VFGERRRSIPGTRATSHYSTVRVTVVVFDSNPDVAAIVSV